MRSPMKEILEKRTAAAREEVEDLRKIIEEEEAACASRIDARVRPILVAEFRRVARRYAVERVIFGNDTCLIVWGKKRALAESTSWNDYGDYPEGLRRLAALCDSVASTYPQDDLTASDLETTP